jgi:hypothetical protein
MLDLCPPSHFLFSGCPNQEIRRPILFKSLIIGIYYYFGADSDTLRKNWSSLTSIILMRLLTTPRWGGTFSYFGENSNKKTLLPHLKNLGMFADLPNGEEHVLTVVIIQSQKNAAPSPQKS